MRSMPINIVLSTMSGAASELSFTAEHRSQRGLVSCGLSLPVNYRSRRSIVLRVLPLPLGCRFSWTIVSCGGIIAVGRHINM